MRDDMSYSETVGGVARQTTERKLGPMVFGERVRNAGSAWAELYWSIYTEQRFGGFRAFAYDTDAMIAYHSKVES